MFDTRFLRKSVRDFHVMVLLNAEQIVIILNKIIVITFIIVDVNFGGLAQYFSKSLIKLRENVPLIFSHSYVKLIVIYI